MTLEFEIEQNSELALELIVDGNLPTINSNFDSLKLAIQTRLKDYEIKVTEENLAQAKKDSTELGKAAKKLADAGKNKAKEFAEPIEQFKGKILELVGLITAGQDFIKKQVAVFEDEKKKHCAEKMNQYMLERLEALEVKPLHRTATINSLIGISKIDKKGELTKAAKIEIDALVNQCKMTQETIENRLEKLKSSSLEAGLKLPLQPSAVWEFIGATNEVYSQKLAEAIKNELSRQQTLLALEKEKLEREARATIQAEIKKEEVKVQVEKIQEAYQEAENRTNYTVQVDFPIVSDKPFIKDKIIAFFKTELSKTRLPKFNITIK